MKALCGCTDHGHQAVRDAIRINRLHSVPAVFQFLEWKTPNGCASCRPAVNYYLISTWPKEAKDDPQSRFINERSHANIQKDGTYSVIPRMWGGETNASELRRIADVVDKYQIPTVKVTGGQRIDLLGVKKEDLVGVWRDLGMPCGHAYAKALRTVKTCGQRVVPHGHAGQHTDGQDLERAMWRMYAPHKVKFAVSGCPRNCAEAGIKDVGIIGVDSGWEMHIAGNGGIKTEVAHFPSSRPPKKCWSTPAPSCSSTAWKAGTWSARCTTSTGSAWTTSRSASSKTPTAARPCGRSCRLPCRGARPLVRLQREAAVDTRQFEAISA